MRNNQGATISRKLLTAVGYIEPTYCSSASWHNQMWPRLYERAEEASALTGDDSMEEATRLCLHLTHLIAYCLSSGNIIYESHRVPWWCGRDAGTDAGRLAPGMGFLNRFERWYLRRISGVSEISGFFSITDRASSFSYSSTKTPRIGDPRSNRKIVQQEAP